jgi:hypothetical protein
VHQLAGAVFPQSLSRCCVKAFGFQKIAKASFRTPKITFSTVPIP